MLSDSGNCCRGAFCVYIGNMSLKRPVAGRESCKQDSFLYKKVYCANCEKSNKLWSCYWVMCFKISTILKNI